MTQVFEMRSQGMPTEMQVLLSAYPRDTWHGHHGWEDHSYFSELTLFRQIRQVFKQLKRLGVGKPR